MTLDLQKSRPDFAPCGGYAGQSSPCDDNHFVEPQLSLSWRKPGEAPKGRRLVGWVALILLLGQPASVSPAAAAERQIQTKSGTIFLVDEGTGPTLVILHGLPDSSENQWRLIDELARDHRVIAYDRLGMGKSGPAANDAYGLDDQVENLRDLLAALSLAPVTLVGHSAGGTLAVLFAAKYPQQVSRLALINPVLRFEPGHTGLCDWNTKLLQTRGLGGFFLLFHNRLVTRGILKHLFYDDRKVTDEMVSRYHAYLQTAAGRRHFLGTLRSYYVLKKDALLQASSKIREQKIPVKLLWAENDPDMPLADARQLADDLGAQGVSTIARCGHLPQLELDDDRLRFEMVRNLRLATN